MKQGKLLIACLVALCLVLPVIAAADTFRAAASEQLEIWVQRGGIHARLVALLIPEMPDSVRSCRMRMLETGSPSIRIPRFGI